MGASHIFLLMIAWASAASLPTSRESQLILRLREVISQTLEDHRPDEDIVSKRDFAPVEAESTLNGLASCMPVPLPPESLFLTIAKGRSKDFRRRLGLIPIPEAHAMECLFNVRRPVRDVKRHAPSSDDDDDEGDYDELIPPMSVIALVVLVPGLTIVLVCCLMIASFLMADNHPILLRLMNTGDRPPPVAMPFIEPTRFEPPPPPSLSTPVGDIPVYSYS